MLSKTHQLKLVGGFTVISGDGQKRLRGRKCRRVQSTTYPSNRTPSAPARIYEITSTASKVGPRNLRAGAKN